MIVHDIKRLCNNIYRVILDALSICFNGYDPASRKLKNFFLANFILFRGMKLYLIDNLRITFGFRIENFLIVASNKVISEHGFRLTDDYEFIRVKWVSNDAVIKLHNDHVFFIASFRRGD